MKLHEMIGTTKASLIEAIKDMPDDAQVLVEPIPEGSTAMAEKGCEGDLHPCYVDVFPPEPGAPTFIRITTIYSYHKGFAQR